MADPVTVIVPGFMGSSLVDAAAGRTIWDCRRMFWVDPTVLKLSEDGQGDAASGMRVEPLADLWPVYRGLMRRLRRRGHRVLFFAYDWRRPVAEAAERLDRFIAGRVPEGRVNLVGHSMGSMVAALWLAGGGAERLARAVCLALSARGVDMALSVLLEGHTKLAFFNIRADNAMLRELTWTMPSVYEMLPPLDGIFDRANWPDGIEVRPPHLERAESFVAGWNGSLAGLGRLGDRVALIAGVGDRMVRWRVSREGRIDPRCRTTGSGDGWVLSESVRVRGLRTYGFRRRRRDAIRLGFFAMLPLIIGTHSVMPMFRRVQRAVAEFLDEGKVKGLPLLCGP